MQTNARLVRRNMMRLQAKAVADSELERMYYEMCRLISIGLKIEDVPSYIANPAYVGADSATIPVTARSPFLKSHRDEGWRVYRSIQIGDTIMGSMPGERTLTGRITYVSARIMVQPPATHIFHNLTIQVGRNFTNLEIPPTQNLASTDGDDMEFAPGGSVVLDGSIASNGSIYMGSNKAGGLIVNSYVRILKDKLFNKDKDGNITYRKPDTPSPSTLFAPVFKDSEATQVERINKPINMLGINPVEVSTRRSDLFPTTNDVYRSIIVPPPSANPEEYPNADTTKGDDPSIAAVRIYNQADLRLTVEEDGTVSWLDGSNQNVSSTYTDVASTAPVNMFDQREGVNVRTVTVDIAALKTKLDAANFNGILYINQKSGSSANPSGVIIKNASSLPDLGEKGMTIATNGGMYLQGNYNTVNRPSDNKPNVSALLADSVTVLSEGWNIANSDKTIDQRVASPSSTPVDTTSFNSDGTVNHVDTTTTPGNITIHAAIMTGNTPATASDVSGGLQNLLRFLENWYTSDPLGNNSNSGHTMTINGSMNRLFSSAWYTRPFQQPGSVYIQPKLRQWTYDPELMNNSGPGLRGMQRQSRGNYFIW